MLSNLLPPSGKLIFSLYLSPNSFFCKAHNQCSESFYKQEVESDIQYGPSKSADERRKTLDILKRFEEDTANDISFHEGDSDDEGSGIAQRFAGLDLGIISKF